MTAKEKRLAILDVAATHKIVPHECFVTFVSNAAGWSMITGTGCAHYVAHILGIRRGIKGITACDQGFVLKVPMLIEGLGQILPKDVRVNDIWANGALDHCGIVTSVTPGTDAKHPAKIVITHCASNVAAHRLGPTVSDWRTFFHAQGKFYRSTTAQSQ